LDTTTFSCEDDSDILKVKGLSVKRIKRLGGNTNNNNPSKVKHGQ